MKHYDHLEVQLLDDKDFKVGDRVIFYNKESEGTIVKVYDTDEGPNYHVKYDDLKNVVPGVEPKEIYKFKLVGKKK